ncbi:hypothetical protein GA0116948_10876 [Chitinophaga costaii]|uniref:Uncharacterized protein n=1 Tax=Chitinophaga costaii TaxID=1335309 RepID=A0A1C4EFU2_9BACT|nr:DsrE family protein [Chitinophaga costaii]PUZ23855.1 hypothetical protein DCM91_13760 [Chitinophaga costaii]SCC42401.1 hypothetical protein GA0116948_10876 [Chitinophaga costaii]
MKKTAMQVVCLLLLTTTAYAQADTSKLSANKAFAGAQAKQLHYNAIYQLDNNDPKIVIKAFRNITNALNDPRLQGKVTIELVTFAAGTDVVLKGSAYENDLKELIEKGVIVAQCANSIRERKVSPDQLYDFIPLVPSGNGELILRQAEHWAVVKP